MPAKDQKTMPLPVTLITDETPDTKTFRFGLGPNKPFPFIPGQFVILSAEIWNPKRNKIAPVNRAFSIASSPLEEDYIEITARKYQDGRMTPWLHDSVKIGQVLPVRGPEGEFVFREGETDDLVLIAGGIGIAPYRSMIRYILAKKLPVRIRLIYSARTPQDFAYKAELDRDAVDHPSFQCLYTVTRGHEGWTGRTGRVDEGLLRGYVGNPKTLFYLCGPDPMLKELTLLLLQLGVAKEAVRSERW